MGVANHSLRAKIQKYARPNKKALTLVDLFAGVGGFSLGAHLAGFESILAVEADPIIAACYERNFPVCSVQIADLGTANCRNWLPGGKKKDRVTVVAGGPPCQGFSLIGKRDPKDLRNSLVGTFFAHVKAIAPKIFIFENVPGILIPPFDSLLENAYESVTKKYELLGPFVVNASDFGAATRRKRVMLIGYDSNEVDRLSNEDFLKEKKKPEANVYHALHDLPRAVSDNGSQWAKYPRQPNRGVNGEYARKARRLPSNGIGSRLAKTLLNAGLVSGFQATNHSKTTLARFRDVEPGNSETVGRYPRLSWEAVCSTLRAGTAADHGSFQAVRPIHPEENRVITVREAARIQGFPDWMQFHHTKWHSFRMIGNSVSPCLSESLFSYLQEKVDPN